MFTFGRRGHLQSLLQVETSECGLVCLAMVAKYYDSKIDLNSLRRRYGLSNQGASLESLMSIANDMEVNARPLKLPLEDLSKLKLPAILHWNFNHFVVLAKTKRKVVVIYDPAVGEREYSWEAVSQRFTGIALELTPRTGFSPDSYSDKNQLSLSDFWKGITGVRSSLIQIFVLSLLIQIFTLATPFYFQVVVDDVLIKRDIDLLSVLALGFLALTLISVATKALREFSSLYLVSQLNYNIGDSVFYHLIRLPLSYFEKRHMGDIVSRFNSLRPIQDFITGSLIAVLIDGILAVTTFALMFIYSAKLSLIVLGAILVYAVFRMSQFRPLRNANLESIAARAKQDSGFMESVRALRGIKLGGKEQERQNSWRSQFVESINTEARMGRLTISYESANNILTGCEYVLIIFLGAQYVLNGALTIGMLYAFLAYRSSFSNAIISVINHLINYWMLGLHLERVSDITQTPKEENLESDFSLILPVEGNLVAENLQFRYSSQEPPIFSDFNIAIEPGEFVAVFGPSGVGKTTLLKTLMGLVERTSGELLIDDMPLHALGQKSYRHHIGAVMQDDVLLSGTLKDNISFFDVNPNVDKVRKSAGIASIAHEIDLTPMGYDSLIGDMGSSLSVGQQQRVLLARALYRTPKILFLDEGTAHVDQRTESLIMHNLKRLELTVIYVTHNKELLQFADKVIYWEDSKIPKITADITQV